MKIASLKEQDALESNFGVNTDREHCVFQIRCCLHYFYEVGLSLQHHAEDSSTCQPLTAMNWVGIPTFVDIGSLK